MTKCLKVFNIYLEDSDERVCKIPIPAETCEEALQEVTGNGTVVGKSIDRGFGIDTSKLFCDLNDKGWKQSEIAVIIRLIERFKLDVDSLPYD